MNRYMMTFESNMGFSRSLSLSHSPSLSIYLSIYLNSIKFNATPLRYTLYCYLVNIRYRPQVLPIPTKWKIYRFIGFFLIEKKRRYMSIL